MTRRIVKSLTLSLAFVLLMYSGYGLSRLYEIQIVRKDKPVNTQISEINSRVLGSSITHQNKNYPERLKIPRINVDAVIDYVGINENGEMATPNNIFDVGWFSHGPLPGDQGTAVIDGHLNGESGEPGVFSNLNKLIPGDRIYIENVEGTSKIFVVVDTQVIDPGYAPEVFSRNDGIYLNLITCEGKWNTIKKNYSKRFIVFAELREQLF